MDLPKFVSFLWSQSLHLTRLGDLPDPYEGRFPPHMMPGVDQEYTRTERLCGRDPGDDPRFAESMTRHVLATVYVNCWCCSAHESEALWRIYGHPSGIAITTTFSRLKQALPDSHYVGCVTYLDYEREVLSEGNFFNLAMHKRTFFAHEHEVRVATAVMPVDFTRPPNLKGQTPPFLTQPMPFETFDGVLVSPYAPPWFVAVVAELVRRYECPIPVRISAMSGR